MPRGRPKKVQNETKTQDKIKAEYQVKGKTKLVSALCRQSICIKGNYYTFEYKEERELPVTEEINLIKEKDSLWYSVNSEVDNQINNLLDWLNEKNQ